MTSIKFLFYIKTAWSLPINKRILKLKQLLQIIKSRSYRLSCLQGPEKWLQIHEVGWINIIDSERD